MHGLRPIHPWHSGVPPPYLFLPTTSLSLCPQAELCFDNQSYYRSLMEYFGCYTLHPSLGKREALASSAVRAADKIDAALIIVFTVTGQTARLVAKYKPACPVLTVSSGPAASAAAARSGSSGPWRPQRGRGRVGTGRRWRGRLVVTRGAECIFVVVAWRGSGRAKCAKWRGQAGGVGLGKAGAWVPSTCGVGALVAFAAWCAGAAARAGGQSGAAGLSRHGRHGAVVMLWRVFCVRGAWACAWVHGAACVVRCQ